MATETVLFPLRETALVLAIKLPLREQAFVLQGFILFENVIQLRQSLITIMENVRSRLILDADLIDRNHVKLKWYGEEVPAIEIYKKSDGDENYPTTPLVTTDWTPSEYTLLLDTNAYDMKLRGVNNTGESNEISLGENKDYEINCDITIPINEKNYFIDVELHSEYRIEVNL